MTSVFKVSRQSDLLQQVALIEPEIKEMLKDASVEGNNRQVYLQATVVIQKLKHKHIILLTREEMESIFKAKNPLNRKRYWKSQNVKPE